MMSTSWHCTKGIKVCCVIPDNNGQITFEDSNGKERLTMWLPEPQWMALIEALPLADGFYVSHSEKIMRGPEAFGFLSAVFGVQLNKQEGAA